MTSELDRLAQPTAHVTGLSTEAARVEQARAIAEVQAAVVVAQNVPRDPRKAAAEMQDACSRLAMAERAFYSMPRGKGPNVVGPTVHLARELARIFGNIQYGVHEIRRDDDAGMSEVQAFAWDVETNVRSTRTFQVPHQRMAKGKRQPLTDLGDVYLNNQNVGARAVRECIFTVLPAWFTDEAQDTCNRTLREGDGPPLSERINGMLAAFGEYDVDQRQLEERLGRPVDAWEAGDVAQAGVLYRSIQRGETRVVDEFPPPDQRVTPEELPAEQGGQ